MRRCSTCRAQATTRCARIVAPPSSSARRACRSRISCGPDVRASCAASGRHRAPARGARLDRPGRRAGRARARGRAAARRTRTPRRSRAAAHGRARPRARGTHRGRATGSGRAPAGCATHRASGRPRSRRPLGAATRAAAAAAALMLNRARALAEGLADELGAEIAGEARRWVRDRPRARASRRGCAGCARAARAPRRRSSASSSARRRDAVGVTVEGVAVELVAAGRRFGTELAARHRLARVRRRRSARCRMRRTRKPSTRARSAVVPARARESAVPRRTAAARRARRHPRRPPLPTTWSDGRRPC